MHLSNRLDALSTMNRRKQRRNQLLFALLFLVLLVVLTLSFSYSHLLFRDRFPSSQLSQAPTSEIDPDVLLQDGLEEEEEEEEIPLENRFIPEKGKLNIAPGWLKLSFLKTNCIF
jgi:hypothetical protein